MPTFKRKEFVNITRGTLFQMGKQTEKISIRNDIPLTSYINALPTEHTLLSSATTSGEK